MRVEVHVGNRKVAAMECTSIAEIKQRLDLRSCQEYGDELCPKRGEHGHIPPRRYAGRESVMIDRIQYRPARLPEIGDVHCLVIRGHIINTVVTLIPEARSVDPPQG